MISVSDYYRCNSVIRAATVGIYPQVGCVQIACMEYDCLVFCGCNFDGKGGSLGLINAGFSYFESCELSY